MTIAHVRNGVLIRRFPVQANGSYKGRILNAAGAVICMPPVPGFSRGDDKILPVETETIDASTAGPTTTSLETIVEETRVLDRTTISDRPVTIEMVAAERQRRFDEGFDYDFGDARGVHHIGTTERDMKGWNEVTDMANAAINLGLGASATIDILTETAPATVTADEWSAILMAAAQARQPLWAASFALQAMDPIPANYADDAHWT